MRPRVTLDSRTWEWRLPQWAEFRFLELVHDLSELPEESDEAAALRDEIRSLPGFPAEASEHDLIYRSVTTITTN
jgi:hypothetical protein